jgi:hypothetical protein
MTRDEWTLLMSIRRASATQVDITMSVRRAGATQVDNVHPSRFSEIVRKIPGEIVENRRVNEM